MAWGIGLWFTRPVREWVGDPRRRAWAVPLVGGVLAALFVGRWDGAALRFIAKAGLSRPDAGRATHYVLLAASVIAAGTAWKASKEKHAKLRDWGASCLLAFLACRLSAMVVGRPRPKFGDPGYFISPFGQYPVSGEVGVRHSWEAWVKGVGELWSMPSVEASLAALAGVLVASRCRGLRVPAGLAVFAAGLAVVVTSGGYPSDVVMGAAVGCAIGRVVLQRERNGPIPADARRP